MSNNNNTNTSAGIGLGSVIAAIVSWTTYHSIGWAIVHGLLGWLFVIWYLIWGKQ
jgi:hypothetical protein